jgi:hypothetical protein
MNKIVIFLLFSMSWSSPADFTIEGKEYEAIGFYFSSFYDSIQLDSESVIYLIFNQNKKMEDGKKVKLVFYIDFGMENKFYVGIEGEKIKGQFKIKDFVSSPQLGKVVNFINIDIEDVFKSTSKNIAIDLLRSENKPNFCKIQNNAHVVQNPLIKKQQFFFDLNSLNVVKNNNYETDEKKPHQIFINLPDNLNAQSINISRTKTNKKKSQLDQTNKNVLTEEEKKEIMNVINSQNPSVSNLVDIDTQLNNFLAKANEKNNNRIIANVTPTSEGNVYEDFSSSNTTLENSDFPQFTLESIQRISHPLIDNSLKPSSSFPKDQDFETFKKSIEGFVSYKN